MGLVYLFFSLWLSFFFSALLPLSLKAQDLDCKLYSRIELPSPFQLTPSDFDLPYLALVLFGQHKSDVVIYDFGPDKVPSSNDSVRLIRSNGLLEFDGTPRVYQNMLVYSRFEFFGSGPRNLLILRKPGLNNILGDGDDQEIIVDRSQFPFFDIHLGSTLFWNKAYDFNVSQMLFCDPHVDESSSKYCGKSQPASFYRYKMMPWNIFSWKANNAEFLVWQNYNSVLGGDSIWVELPTGFKIQFTGSLANSAVSLLDFASPLVMYTDKKALAIRGFSNAHGVNEVFRSTPPTGFFDDEGRLGKKAALGDVSSKLFVMKRTKDFDKSSRVFVGSAIKGSAFPKPIEENPGNFISETNPVVDGSVVAYSRQDTLGRWKDVSISYCFTREMSLERDG